MSYLITALIGLLGIVVGAWAQYLLNRKAEYTRQYSLQKLTAYTDFFKSVAQLAILRRDDKTKQKAEEALSLLTDSKIRIALYGDPKIVKQAAAFFRDHQGLLNTKEAMRAFANIVIELRKLSITHDPLDCPEDLTRLLFDEDVSE